MADVMFKECMRNIFFKLNHYEVCRFSSDAWKCCSTEPRHRLPFYSDNGSKGPKFH